MVTLILKSKITAKERKQAVKRDFMSIICMTLVCATVMLGVMSIYKYVSPMGTSRRKLGHAGFAFELTSLGADKVV